MVNSTTPQRLGGQSSDNIETNSDAGKLLTPDEIRRRRIEALDRTITREVTTNSSSKSSGVVPLPQANQTFPSTITTTITAATHPVANVQQETMRNNDSEYFVDEDEVDDELQAALALSLQDVTTPAPLGIAVSSNITVSRETAKISMKSDANCQTYERPLPEVLSPNQSIPEKVPPEISSSSTTNIDSLGNVRQQMEPQYLSTTILQEPLQNISLYHKLLWDDQLTTESDKHRWVSQGIDVRSSNDNNRIMETYNTTTRMDIDATNTEGIEIQQHEPQQQQHTASIMDAITASHLSWGLIQQHGGPCGVLAAIQAELLRNLLFSNEGDNKLTETSVITEPHNIRRALAKAIALVLSRAALAPPIADARHLKSDKCDDPPAVRIVLPTNESQALTWQDLEPWYPVPDADTAVPSNSALKVYCIPISVIDDSSFAATTGTAATATPLHQVEADAVTSKRQKVVPDNSNKASMSTTRQDVSLHSRIEKLAQIVEMFLLDENHCNSSKTSTTTDAPALSPLDCFRRPGGVLLLVISLIATRTISMIIEDFDDPIDTRLTAQFGHCSQELINLLLTGQAVSNVFDNTLSPSGDMVCRGIQSRPVIGYLTQLEAMRYCEVGGYYKMPLFPIWVVGSTSHFTVLFGDLSALKESKSDMLLDECRRAFKAVEGGEENGFIQTDQLTTVLRNLHINLGGSNESDEVARIQTLAVSLEVGGAGIILWDDFWKAASRLLTGASLETVIDSADDIRSLSPINVDNANAPPPLLSNFAVSSDVHFKPEARRPTDPASAHTNYIESDEEMARRLAAEWENAGATGMMALSNAAESHLNFSPSIDVDPQPGSMGDEEYAQYLQRQFDSENAVDAAIVDGDSGSVAAISGSPFPVMSDTDETASIPTTPTKNLFTGDDDYEDTKPAAQVAASTESLTFEQYGDTFSLYHYNGLRGGVLTPFRITRLTAEEAVGASIALNRGTGGAASHGSNGTQDLEDVVRTKWPSCAINWLGKTPPCID